MTLERLLELIDEISIGLADDGICGYDFQLLEIKDILRELMKEKMKQ